MYTSASGSAARAAASLETPMISAAGAIVLSAAAHSRPPTVTILTGDFQPALCRIGVEASVRRKRRIRLSGLTQDGHGGCADAAADIPANCTSVARSTQRIAGNRDMAYSIFACGSLSPMWKHRAEARRTPRGRAAHAARESALTKTGGVVRPFVAR